MSNGFHAAEDGSLARSTGGAAARGALLIALAIVIGLLLLTFALNDQETEVASTEDDTEQVDGEGDAATDDDTSDGDGVEAVNPSTDDEDADTTNGGDAADDDAESIPVDPIESDARSPSEVNVLVANGVGTSGIAGAAADTLVADGYIGVAADAPSTTASVIFYREGYDADARAVATVLGSTPDIIQPVPADGTVPINQNAIDDGRAAAANVVVVIGTDGAIPTS